MTPLCESCSKEISSASCPQCKEEILRLGPHCYLCGARLDTETASEPELSEKTDDFSNRVLCSDGSCIGVINEEGICKVCGKPYNPESE